MGLRETLRKAAQTAIAATGNVAVSANYASFQSTSYDVSTGTVAPTFTSVEGISIILSEFAFEVIDGETIQPEDQKAMIAARTISTVTPKPKDRITKSGETWEVVKAMTDPAEAAWVLHIRRP